MTEVWLRSIRDAIVGGAFLLTAAVIGASMPSFSSIAESKFAAVFGLENVRAAFPILSLVSAFLGVFFLGRSLVSPWVWSAKNRGR